MDFGEILSKAWKIIWKHKVLWIFGLLASCGAGNSGGGGGGGGGSRFNGAPGNGSGGDFTRNLPLWMQNFFFQIQRGFEDGTIWIYIVLIVLGLILFSLLLSALFLVLRTVGKTALIRGTWRADEGQEKITFSDLLNESWHYFWRVLLFSVVLGILGMILGFILILPVILVTVFTLGCGLLCLIPLLIAINWSIQAFVELTVAAMVGEDLDILKAIERAWELLTGNLGSVALITLILYVGRFIITAITIAPLLLVITPAVLGILADTRIATIIGLAVSGLGFIIYILLAIVLSSGVQAYFGAAWTLIFRRLTGRSAEELAAPTPETSLAPLPDKPAA